MKKETHQNRLPISRQGTTSAIRGDARAVRGILLDLDGVVYVGPDLREDFSDLTTDDYEAVVVGDAGEFFTYDLLNQAYRKLLRGAAFQRVSPLRARGCSSAERQTEALVR